MFRLYCCSYVGSAEAYYFSIRRIPRTWDAALTGNFNRVNAMPSLPTHRHFLILEGSAYLCFS